MVISSVDDVITVCDVSCQKYYLDQRELIIDTSGGLIEVCIGESCTHQKLRPCHWSCDSCNDGKCGCDNSLLVSSSYCMPECPSLSSDVGSSYCVKPKRDNFHMHSNVVLNPDFTIEAWASSSDVSLLQDINLSIYANRLSIDDCLVEVENDDVEGWRNIAWRIRSLNHMTEVTGFVNGKLAAQQVVPCRYLDYGLEKELADDEDVFDFFAY